MIGADHIGSKTSESVERTAVYGFTKPTRLSPSLDLVKTSGIPLSMARSGLRWLAAECATSGSSFAKPARPLKGRD